MDVRGRRTIRLDGYDYSDQGPYFVTICTSDRRPLFGEIIDQQMVLNPYGELVASEWLRSTEIRPGLILDAFVVMPNHIHGIVTLQNPASPVNAQPDAILARRPRTLGSFVAGYKSVTTRLINELRGTPRAPVWQRNYYEHIIRSERTYDRIWEYIATNPQRWDTDSENPANQNKPR